MDSTTHQNIIDCSHLTHLSLETPIPLHRTFKDGLSRADDEASQRDGPFAE